MKHVGQRIGRLTLVEKHLRAYRNVQTVWTCRCDCGLVVRVRQCNLGRTLSCGCYLRDRTTARNTRHGFAPSPTYNVWLKMRLRCTDPTQSDYERYGGRGITVCRQWLQSFEAFLADMGERPSPLHSIERKDNDGPYAPWNCRWATASEQARNRRSSRRLEYAGTVATLAEWSERTGVSAALISQRLRRGWTVPAVFQPARSLDSAM